MSGTWALNLILAWMFTFFFGVSHKVTGMDG